MKRIALLLLVVLLSFGTSCKKDKKEETQVEESTVNTDSDDTSTDKVVRSDSDEKRKVQVRLESRSGSTATGTAIFTEEKGAVTMIAIVSGLSPGSHAIHLHESADCSSEDGTSTGGHWNPTKQAHGKWGSTDGYHKGDIGNFTANENGQGTITFITPEWCIGCGDPAKDILGKALIVHQGVDDFTTQPTGDAGGRISCGGILETAQ